MFNRPTVGPFIAAICTNLRRCQRQWTAEKWEVTTADGLVRATEKLQHKSGLYLIFNPVTTNWTVWSPIHTPNPVEQAKLKEAIGHWGASRMMDNLPVTEVIYREEQQTEDDKVDDADSFSESTREDALDKKEEWL